jgi:hypothetical protein
MVRWYNANRWDLSEQGRRYAPWPFKSAGAVEMSNDEYLRTVLLAGGLSLVIALVDLIIVKAKQSGERQRLENMPSGSIIIERIPPEEEPGGEE